MSYFEIIETNTCGALMNRGSFNDHALIDYMQAVNTEEGGTTPALKTNLGENFSVVLPRSVA